MSFRFPERLSLAQIPTPLQPLRRLSAALGGPTIWVKRDDLTGCLTSGNKVRKLEFVLAEALSKGADTIITVGGLQSNHCRTTAVLCAQLGLHCHLLLRGGEATAVPDGNLLLDQLAGATITHYPMNEYKAREAAILAQWENHYLSLGRRPYTIPVGASDGCGLWGYIAASSELLDDFDRVGIDPGHVICATGSGGTQAGLTLGLAGYGSTTRVWGINVCDDEAYFQQKICDDLTDWRRRYPDCGDQLPAIEQLAIGVIDGYVGAGYGVAGPPVFSTIRELARTEGLVLDPVYTGKAFHGMLEQYRQGRFDGSESIVFVHTGGLFGLFPHRSQLQLPAIAGPA